MGFEYIKLAERVDEVKGEKSLAIGVQKFTR